MQEKKPKPTLDEWFVKATGSGRLALMVPPHITSLPCGCTREKSDPLLFKLKRKGSFWFHDDVNCGVEPLDLPKESVPRAKIAEGLDPHRKDHHVPYYRDFYLL